MYLTHSQLLPYQRTAELFQELAGIALSPSTLQRAVTVAATHLEAPVAAIRGALLTASLMPTRPVCAWTAICTGCTCSAPRS